MKIINFRFQILICYIVVLCVLLTVVWIGLVQQQPTEVGVATEKRTPILSNYSHKHRVMATPKYQRMPVLKELTEISWQRILAGSRLRLGFSYSRGRTGVHYVLGVPTVRRKDKNYLLQTLAQLIEQMNDSQRSICLIVVFIGETNVQAVQQIWQEINESFGHHLDDGLIDVISPPANYYPDFESLYMTLHDEPERVRWRTKQTLDYMYLMTYAQSRGSFYLQLEDDISPNVGYMEYIIKLTDLHSYFRLGHHRRWIVLSFCELGFIGKLFHTEELRPFLAHVQIFYNDQPIDWLLQSYVKLRCCRWDSFEMPDCTRDYFLYFIRASQSQFQHIGQESSLRAKQQMLQDKRFAKDSGRIRMDNLRQPFNLMNSHKTTMLLERKYLQDGETFFWGYMPQTSSLIHYLHEHQYGSNQIRIRNGRESVTNLSELTVEVLRERPVLDINGLETRRCGFIMSYTHQIGIQVPYTLFFYMNENNLDKNETRWFRLFDWRGKANSLTLNFNLQIVFLLCWIS